MRRVTDLPHLLAAFNDGTRKARETYAAEHPTPEDIKEARAEYERRRYDERKKAK